MIGKKFIKEHNGFPHKVEVLVPMADGTKFLVALGDGECKEVMTYNEILNMVEAELDENNEYVWSFEAVLGHKKYKGIFEVKIFIFAQNLHILKPKFWYFLLKIFILLF